MQLSALQPHARARRAVTAAVAGNVLEWYDFAVYAFLAGVLAQRFFPSDDELGSLLKAFAAFGVGFVVRPLGGIVIGRLADRHGRKHALVLTILLMALGTIGIGVLPDYQAIGALAPVLLVACRLLQGFSAGGEWGGATAFLVEWAPPNRRGLFGSFQQASVAAGLLLGSALSAACSTLLEPAQLEGWGWRIPFLIGGLLLPLGLYLRRSVEETPAFRAAPPAATSPATAWQAAARALGFTVLWTVAYYIALSYLPTYTQKFAGLTRAQALWSNTLGLAVLVLVVPGFGLLSDRIGRKPLLLASCALFVALPYPLFAWMAYGGGLTAVLLAQVAFTLAIALFSGPGPAAIAEMFPTRLRTTWMSIGYSLSVAIFGGFAPYIATWLIDATGSPLAPTGYLIGAALVSGGVILALRETAHEPLR